MKLTCNLSTIFVHLCLTNLVSSFSFQYISDCYFYDQSATPGSDNVTFICAEIDRENLVFDVSTIKCSNAQNSRGYNWPGTINFQNCRFPSLIWNYFDWFPNLHTFNISNVELETLETIIFREAKNLVELDVSHNKLDEIPKFIFFDTVNLKYVNFCDNSIKRVERRAFDGRMRLESLNLSHNRINEIEFRAFILFSNLLVLDLSNNNLTKLDDHIFDNMFKLRQLDLSFNSISNLKIETFIYLGKLEELNLRHTNLSNIEQDTFIYQYKLVSLDLSENYLKKLDFDLLFPIPNYLQSLRLSRNQLKDLDGFRDSLFPQLTSLYIQGNQFNCSYLAQFMGSINWDKNHVTRLGVSLIDANQSYIQDISCNNTDSEGNENNESAFNVQIAVQTTQNTTKFPERFGNSIKNFALLFLCIAFTIFVFVFTVINRNKICSLLPCSSICYQRVTNHLSEESAVEFVTNQQAGKHSSKE